MNWPFIWHWQVEQLSRIVQQQGARQELCDQDQGCTLVGSCNGSAGHKPFPMHLRGLLRIMPGCRLRVPHPSAPPTCGAETRATANRLLCGVCGDWHTQLIAGEELILESIELQMKEELLHV